MNLTPLGIFHTIVSVVAVLAAVVALSRDGRVSPKSGIGRFYIWALVITCLTGFPIFRHGTITPPHVLGVITLVALAVAAVAGMTRVFGRFSVYVETISYSATVLFLGISTVTETLTRLPPSGSVAASPEDPILTPLYLGLLVSFLIWVTLQVRRLRRAARP
ncbi:MAG TPA: hypothetical protein VFM04_02980 [Candidatus Methylomirabilis sp.]|nr:hypothetical protein [Candidatus Methylomirabilis sp.]